MREKVVLTHWNKHTKIRSKPGKEISEKKEYILKFRVFLNIITYLKYRGFLCSLNFKDDFFRNIQWRCVENGHWPTLWYIGNREYRLCLFGGYRGNSRSCFAVCLLSAIISQWGNIAGTGTYNVIKQIWNNNHIARWM